MFACGRLIFNRNDIYHDINTGTADITAKNRQNDIRRKHKSGEMRSRTGFGKKFTYEKLLALRDYLKTVRGKDGKLKLMLRKKYKKEPK